MTQQRRQRATEAFFGRRHGKTLRPVQAGAVSRLLPALKVDLDRPAPADPRELFPVAVGAVRLEIGFGGGEHLHHEAGRFSDTGFIGVEPFVNGMAKFLAQLEAEPRANIRVYDDDATRLLDWLPEGSVDGIDLLYPDPWPKKRHWKRRFVSAANLDRFARVMRTGAKFRFASDIDTYVNWTLAHCRAHPSFEWIASSPDDWRLAYEGWPGTRYEAKAVREGRAPAYLAFLRR
ncbi:tRNA (guanine(46)-N(7))-methyltransferase TrmB [Aquamicrobium sp. LC103]|uniref:tRNA (guanine(46)-N(7))-methyltransferase TrmB n=1 Tax=Aquamicrobium sp. LC103 TaxID=1120658 RepID=UPI00063EA2DE|nr:tRNA (guanine(46)-N(7))-methyltransferase TrmB [Aquamicrobium sp. LC103]TKT74921.1 tRNA (guanosine(46)-N7)-methyltransferase TrmB [Aquamicrobium sp. LC103]